MNHRFDEVSTAEATQLAVFCNMHDSSDFPVALLRNVTLFCRSGGLQGMASAFTLPSSLMPPSMAFALITILYNIKMWLNYRAVLQLFGPVRTNALRYMCGLTDAELRMTDSRNMADFLWTSVKENVDSPVFFDKEGLELAFKYFSSTTLAMRLAGINQINMHINNFNEMCNTESVVEVENVGLQLANWILNSKILEHIFGPNLHVEVIKQSHVLLNFLAVEGKITNEHIDVIWQAAQLKYCAKQVQDLLLPLIKNLEAGPVLHLYDLMKELPTGEHSEQTIHLAQVLQKFIWTSSGQLSNILQEASALQHQQHLHPHQQNQQLCCGPGESRGGRALGVPSADPQPDPTAANNPALTLSAVASLSAAARAAAAREDGPPAGGGPFKSGGGRTLLERSAADAPECEFSIQDLEELDDLNDYSDDDDEEEEEEEEDEDDDDEELASTDEESVAQQQQQQQRRLPRAATKASESANRQQQPPQSSLLIQPLTSSKSESSLATTESLAKSTPSKDSGQDSGTKVTSTSDLRSSSPSGKSSPAGKR